MNLCTWNVRGMNDPIKVGEIKKFLAENKIVVVALVETKIKEENCNKILKKFGSVWQWDFNYSHSPRGRIWLGWKHAVVTVQILQETEQMIHTFVTAKSGQFSTFFTPVLNGSIVTATETRDFEACIDGAALAELKCCGHFCSWSNKGQGLSDHSPLLMSCNVNVCTAGRPFKFFNYMADHPKFLQTVQAGWSTGVHGNGNGNRLTQVWTKLKVVKQGLKHLHQHEFAKLEERIENIRTELSLVQTQLADNSTYVLQWTEKEFSEQLKKFLHVQESAYRQKSRIQWLQIGDSNSKFFFSAMKERQARNSIDVLYDSSGKKLTTMQEIKGEISQFYKGLISTAAPSLIGIDVNIVRKGKQLSSSASDELIQHVTESEIDAALKGIDPNKAPGLDGFNSLFFLMAWGVIKGDVYKAVQEFFYHWGYAKAN
ncbi:uncharacterized protein [Spinacia oleracea]|uniref:Endonuclease/exonuclease/phosphatase domain-containing protein n=1 Tax=Spinacia oleracea TaxID=3562 RepID=A0A9R0KD46_SPIOL|nr:uncharacterized protein LOC110804851 [Spinacia oleracea]